MQMPASLLTLAEYGLVEEVVRPLMSGKEAQIYLVISQGEERVAKVYREAEHRNFKHRVEYTEGRKTRNSRDQRAMGKRSRYGRNQDEAAWRAAEVDMIYRLSDAGVPVPKPYHFVDGVLIMEMVKGADGGPAPRLGDLDLGPDEAGEVYDKLLREVVRMLAAGVVHGDLSDFNVLMSSDGPVIIDFPQSVDASANTGARKLLIRDVDNLHNFAKRCMVGVRTRPYAQEMWDLYQRGELAADTQLLGKFKGATSKVNTANVLDLVREAETDERTRRKRMSGRRNADSARLEGVVPAASSDDAEASARADAPDDAVALAVPRRREVVMVSPERKQPPRGRQPRNQRPHQNANDRPRGGGPRQRQHPPRAPMPPRDHRAENEAGQTAEMTDGQRRRRNRRPRHQQSGQTATENRPRGNAAAVREPSSTHRPSRGHQRSPNAEGGAGRGVGMQSRENGGQAQTSNASHEQPDNAGNRGSARRRRRPRRPRSDDKGSPGPDRSQGR